MIEIKNKELKKEVYDKLDMYDKLAISHYMMGEMESHLTKKLPWVQCIC